MSSFMDKVQAVENKFMDLEQQISDPAVIARQEEWQKLTKEHASLMPLVETFRKYKDITHTIEGDQEILNDPDSDDDLMAMAKEEMNGLTKEQADLEDQLHILMLPKDPRDDKNVIMEIRGGAGGDEAALFAGDLFRMYMKYIEKQPGWKTSIISSNEPELGGFKEVVFSIEGSGVFGKLNMNRASTAFSVSPLPKPAAVSTRQRRLLPFCRKQKTLKSISIWTMSASIISVPPVPAVSTSIRRVLPSA